jgi:molybdate transport system substrate-binding protein
MKKPMAALAALALLAAGCGSGAGGAGATTLTVFAAASLADSFGALEKRFEAEHPGVDVRLVLDGSAKLVQQLDEGAGADVFASADQANMDKAVKAGRIDGAPTVFATNRLTIAVPPGNPKGVKGFADLAAAGLTLVVCAPQVPCGAAAQRIEKSTGITLKPVSEESAVTAVRAKVQAGEADAGLVYVTDVTAAAGKLDEVDFPEAAGARNDYPIAVVQDAPQAALARQFRDYVLGAAGRQELGKAGFGTP